MTERPADRVDPAGGGARGFFDGGDRRSHLEQLRHLSQWSRRVLLVTGPRGVGKTAMYRQLSATLEPRAKAARINGALVNADREVLNAVVQGFGLAAPADADTQLLRQLIVEHARDQERSDRFCVTLIDDAELLEARAIEHLIALAADSPMRLVMFGEVRLVPAVDRFAAARDVGWYEIRLSGFDVADVRSYLAWRLQEQGHDGPLPFTEGQIREIARLSEGLPGRVDQMANVLLARIQSAGAGPGGRRFPALHKALLALLVAVLGLAYLMWQPGSDVTPQSSDVEVVRVPVQAADPRPPRDTAVVEESEPAVEPGLETPGESEHEPVAQPEAQPESEREPELLAQPESEPEPEPAEPAASAPAASAPAVPAADPGTARAPQQSVDVRAPTGESTGDTQPTEPEPPTPAVADQAPHETAGAARDADWIMRQPAAAYTLQLASFSTPERADAYLAQQAQPQDFARYRLQRDGRILHVVVYGSFDSRAAADAAASRLPEGVGAVQPWIRTFGQVQEAVRTALQP